VLRVFLDTDGNVIGERPLGRVWHAAIKLSDDSAVEQGVHVALSIEAGLKALASGVEPVWVTLAAGYQVDLPGVSVSQIT
jgi:hypothetical protein